MRFFLLIGVLALCAISAMSNKTVSPLSTAVYSLNRFSGDFLGHLTEDHKNQNFVFSSLSAYLILAMAAYGAEDNTSAQMREALRLFSNDAIALKGFENLLDNLRGLDKVTLEIANKMYIADTLKVKDEYKQLASGPFRSEAAEMDVRNPKDTVQSINNWVAEKTHQKIKDIMTESDINADTRMALLNAIYFKGKWANPFDKKNTEDRTFHLDEKNEIKVPMMHRKGSMIYVEEPTFKLKWVVLPYENRDVQMAIILPDEIEGLTNVEETLKSFDRRRLFAMYPKSREVDLYLPKFKIESTMDLEKNVKQMNMTDMFTDAANFNRISDEKLKVGKIVQKAFIDVNEESSEAAASTKLTFMMKSSVRLPKLDPITFLVDRPFYYIIGTPFVTLFEGHVHNPTA